MSRDSWDLLLFHWPISALILKVFQWFGHDEYVGTMGCLLFAAIGIGLVVSIIYGVVRIIRQNWTAGRTTLWVLGFFVFPYIVGPAFYWKHLDLESGANPNKPTS